MKLKWNKEKTRLQSVPEGVSMTDQSDKNMVDINVIMKNYAKTGLLPQFKDKIGHYIDTTQIPSYMEAQAQIEHAKNLFMQLPSQVRKLMDNNPANLEKVLVNPEYKEILIKCGVLEKPKVIEQSDDLGKPAAKQEQAKAGDKKSDT